MKKLHLSSSFLSQSKCFSSQQGSVQSPGNGLHPALCAEELQPCSFVFLCGCREREKHEALPPAHVHKMSQSSPKSIFSLPSPPCWSVSMGHFQVGERLQLSVVAILGMLFYRLDLLWFGRNERVWHKISKSKTQTGSFSGDFSMWVFFFFSRRDFL